MIIYDYADSIILGIRFDPNFSYIDNIGTIIQTLLNENNEYPELYKLINRDHMTAEIMNNTNDRNEHNIKFTTTDIIITDKIEDYESGYKKLKNKTSIIEKKVFISHKIPNISRVGLVRRFRIPKSKTSPDMIDKIMKIPDVKNTRFTQTEIPGKSSVKGVSDFYNIIFDIKDDATEYIISVDFQRYCSPKYESIADFNFDTFYKKADKKLEESVVEWIKND
jgi:hypothetical protein